MLLLQFKSQGKGEGNFNINYAPENHVRTTTDVKQHSDRAWLEQTAVRLSNLQM